MRIFCSSHIFIFPLLLVLNFFGNCERRIIFATQDRAEMTISGTLESKETFHRLFASLVSIPSPICRQTKGLADPYSTVPVINGQFQFRFVSPGEYIILFFEDKNGDRLLLLNEEPWYTTGNGPIQFDGKPLAFNFKDLKSPPVKLASLREFPEEYPILCLINSKDNTLYTKRIQPPHLSLSSPPEHFEVQFCEDTNEDGVAQPEECLPQQYSLSIQDAPKEIIWNQRWLPLNISIPGANSSIFRLECPEIQYSRNFTHTDEIILNHLPAGEYTTSFFHPQLKRWLPTGKFRHPDSTPFISLKSIQGFRFKSPPAQSTLTLFLNNKKISESDTSVTTEIHHLPLGNYLAVLSNPLLPSHEEKSLVHSKVQVYEFSITEDETFFTLPDSPYPEAPSLTGVFQAYKSYTRGNLLLHEKSACPQISNLLSAIPLSKTGKNDFVRFSIAPLTSFFSVSPDFDGDFFIDPIEQLFSRAYKVSDFGSEQNYVDMPFVYQGTLKIHTTFSQPEDYFIEVHSPRIKELLASAFLKEHGLSLPALPLEVPLKLKIIHDINKNEYLDPTDPQSEIENLIIPANTRILEVTIP
jgi:hypothetical protein